MEEKKKLVIVVSHGFEDERSSVAWSIANGGLANDIDISIFLVSAGVDWARKGAGQAAHLLSGPGHRRQIDIGQAPIQRLDR